STVRGLLEDHAMTALRVYDTPITGRLRYTTLLSVKVTCRARLARSTTLCRWWPRPVVRPAGFCWTDRRGLIGAWRRPN
ncbi:hypothetical protein, partial [Actinopolymorpha pittospori]